MRSTWRTLPFFLLLVCSLFSQATLNGQGYFSLINSCIDDATVAVAFTGETEISTCGGDGEPDQIRFATSNLFMAFAYVVVDENDIIVSIGFSNFIDFDMLPLGTLRVYAFSNHGYLTANVGDNFTTTPLAEPCFGLTTNFVTVTNGSPGANLISADLGDEISTCAGDGQADIVNFSATNNSPNTAFVITDADNVVLAVNTTGEVDFEGAGAGLCRVWGVGYNTTIPFEAGDQLSPGNGCGFVSTNFISVERLSLEAATVTLEDGSDQTQTCPGDGEDDFVSFVVDGGTGTQALIVTDAGGNILGLPEGQEVNFENAGQGVCRVYVISYNGSLLAEMGDNIATAQLADGCYALSVDYVTVIRISPVGGSVRTTDDQTEVAVCPGDGGDNSVFFVSDGASGGLFTFVITDENNMILDFSESGDIDFDAAPLGICRVWSLSYQGDLVGEAGQDITTSVLADGCFELSSNFVTVDRSDADGGMVFTEGGASEVTICPGDGLSDLLTFTSFDAVGSFYTYVITDTDNTILGTVDGGQIDFETVGIGVCRVWGLAYSGDLLAGAGDAAATAELATGCYDLSDGFVTVNREQPTGGTVSLEDGSNALTICTQDGNPDLIILESMGASGPSFSYLITDENNIVIGVPLGGIINLDLAPVGVCRLWGLSYDGDLTATMGDDAMADPLATGCFGLSDNFVTVVREDPDGGTVSTEDGETEILVCPNNGTPDIVRFDSTGNADLANFNYVITDTDNVIMLVLFGDNFNFDGSGIGECRVWGLSYDGVLTAGNGDNAATATLASDCYSLSDNFVTVVREIPSGGTVSTEAGETEIFLCPGDGVDDVVSFSSAGAGGGSFTYVITDDQNIILGVPEGNMVNFETAGTGVCRLWGLSYQGDLLAMEGQDAAGTQLASGCFNLSDNFVTVTRDIVSGGTVSTDAGATSITTCPGDDIADVVTFASMGTSGESFTYIVTDENNMILGVPGGNSQDFEGAGVGVCRVWGLSYAGDLLAMDGDIASEVDLATGCFALSDNFIEVTRVVPVGGTLTSDGGDMVAVCGGDNTPDVVTFMPDGNLGSYALLAVQNGIIVGELPALSFDFNNAVAGTYEIYGLSYAGDLLVLPNMMLNDVLASSCFELSSNFVTVEVTVVDGGEISVDGVSDIVYLCPANAAGNILEFSTTSSLTDNNYQYIITTDGGFIFNFLGDGVTSFDFNGFPIETVRIYAVSYTGDFTGAIATNIDEAELSDACYVLSDNFITIINEAPDAGEISIEDDLFCAINGQTDLVVSSTTTSLAGYAIMVTDDAGIVQLVAPDASAVNMASLPEADYRLYGLSYTGNLTVMAGDDIAIAVLADNCYEMTTDFISVTRGETLEGGTLSTLTNQDTVYICPQDGTPDIVGILTTTEGVPYRYAITDETGSILVPASVSNVFNFDTQSPGICRIYGYALSGNPTAFFGQDINTAELSDRCFALSDNYITIVREIPDGGTVSTTDGSTEVTIDLSSGATTVDMASADAAPLASFAYVITDENNIILGMGDGPTFDFGDAPAGVCRVWGLSYVGELLAMMGDDAATAMLASGCWGLSANVVTVTRTAGRPGLEATEPQVNLTPFPNPAGGDELQVVIESDVILEEGRAYVRDQNGRAWAAERVAGGTTTAVVDFDISTLPAGLFVVQYQSEGVLRVVRFIRQ